MVKTTLSIWTAIVEKEKKNSKKELDKFDEMCRPKKKKKKKRYQGHKKKVPGD